MATLVKTSIQINARPEKVWTVFSDFSAYPNWNPFLKEISGDVQIGKTININAGGMKFKPTVLRLTKNQELTWVGRLLFPGIFDGEHRFIFIDNGDGTTTFQHEELFKGILVPLFKKKLTTDTKAGFEAMNEALKAKVEAL